LLSSRPCGDVKGKHLYRVHSTYPGHFAVMQCEWSQCKAFKVIDHADLVKLVVA